MDAFYNWLRFAHPAVYAQVVADRPQTMGGYEGDSGDMIDSGGGAAWVDSSGSFGGDWSSGDSDWTTTIISAYDNLFKGVQTGTALYAQYVRDREQLKTNIDRARDGRNPVVVRNTGNPLDLLSTPILIGGALLLAFLVLKK